MPDLNTLYAAAIGGTLALGGTFISQAFGLLAGSIQRKHERDVRQRQRLESLVDAVGVSMKWIKTLSMCKTLENLLAETVPLEARRAAMLAQLYFPDLVEPTAAYSNSLTEHFHLAVDVFNPEIPASVGAQMAMALRQGTIKKDAFEQDFKARTRLDAAIAREARKYMHT